MSGLTTLQLLITIGAWWVIGRGALAGHFEWGWVLGWALMLLTTIPIQLGINGLQSELVLAISTLFKERLLFGALRLRPDEARRLELVDGPDCDAAAFDTTRELGFSGAAVLHVYCQAGPTAA